MDINIAPEVETKLPIKNATDLHRLVGLLMFYCDLTDGKGDKAVQNAAKEKLIDYLLNEIFDRQQSKDAKIDIGFTDLLNEYTKEEFCKEHGLDWVAGPKFYKKGLTHADVYSIVYILLTKSDTKSIRNLCGSIDPASVLRYEGLVASFNNI
jgi:hypothetical protein